MSSSIQPIKVYGKGGPNPPKVAMIVAELQLPHEIIPTEFADVKKPDFIAINPNGRMPAIYDPNTDLTLWESGAIIEYLIERYDTENKFSFPKDSNEAYLAKQWLFFQVSGQGPYYGQAAWFERFHPEKLPSARERYVKEINRVTGVLEEWLAKQEKEHGAGSDGPWLVGNKFSYADLAFIPWQKLAVMFFGGEEFDQDKFPLVKAWLEKMLERDAIKGVWEEAMKGR